MDWAELKCKLWTGQLTSQMFLSVVFQIVPLPKSSWGMVSVWQHGQEFWYKLLHMKRQEMPLHHFLSAITQSLCSIYP